MSDGLPTDLGRDALEAAGAVSLLLAARALLVRRAAAVRILCAGQIAACACAVLVRGGLHGQLGLAAIAAALMAGKAAAIWLACSRCKPEQPPPIAGAATLTIAAALVLVAMFAARQSPNATTSNGSFIILGLILTGSLVVATRAAAPWTVAGVLGIETGAALAAIAISPAAALVETVAALLGLASISALLRFERDVPGGA